VKSPDTAAARKPVVKSAEMRGGERWWVVVYSGWRCGPWSQSDVMARV
jgi:hypothetical protein